MSKTYIEKIFKKCILKAEFSKAENLMKKITIKDLDEILFSLAYDKETINSYGFLCHILKKHEKAVYHAIASVLLSNAVNYLPYVYHLALFHQRRAVELEPTNVGYKEYLLYFNDIPEKVLSDKEAIKIAKEILVLDPKNEVASRVIKRTS